MPLPQFPDTSSTPRQPSAQRRALLIAAGGSAILAGCAGTQAVAPPTGEITAPRVRVGDRWRYAKIDQYRREKVAELSMQAVAIEPQLRIRVSNSQGAMLGEEIYSTPWQVLQDLVYGDITRFQTPNPLLPQRLAAGEGMSISNRWHREPGQPWLLWTERIDARQWERIRVPAGEFTALRVQRRIAFDHPDSTRRGCRRDETIWYAPQVNRWVQREWNGTFLWPGMRSTAPLQEDWVLEQLIEYRPV